MVGRYTDINLDKPSNINNIICRRPPVKYDNWDVCVKIATIFFSNSRVFTEFVNASALQQVLINIYKMSGGGGVFSFTLLFNMLSSLHQSKTPICTKYFKLSVPACQFCTYYSILSLDC